MVNFVEIVGYEPDFPASLPTTSYILSYDDDDDDDDDDLMEGRYVHTYICVSLYVGIKEGHLNFDFYTIQIQNQNQNQNTKTQQ